MPLSAQNQPAPLQSAATPAPVYILPYSGVIGPATVKLVEKGLAEAQQGGGQLLVFELDTPGGLDASTREITQLLIGSPIPVAVYVAPGGARAASAGTYILYAAHIAAMAQATSIGAATPVLMGESPLPKEQENPATKMAEEVGEEATEEADIGGLLPPPRTVLERKAENDAVAHIRGLAELRGRNADWAEAAVRQAVSISGEEALAKGVITHLAASRDELLLALDGAEIRLQQGVVTLDTAGAPRVVVAPGLQIAVLSQLASPVLASTMLGLGVPLIMLEFYVGAGGIAAALGLILCALGAYGLNLLPLEYSGGALLLAGVLFILADVLMGFTVVMMLAGVVMVLIGTLLFQRMEGDYWALSSPPIWLLLLISATMLGLMLWLIRLHRRPTITGLESGLGVAVEVLEDFENEGWVLFQGEHWKGQLQGRVQKGERLYVAGVQGLFLALSREPPDTN